MPSSFAWLDASDRDRRRALDVIDLFQQRETVDELGLGSIRDTIADVLAPGTSTIQTRARYFFFIPWIYMALERRAAVEDISARARRAETALIAPLTQSSDSAGTIGALAGVSLKRLPSSVYWSGLGHLGFRLYPGSRDQYHRFLQRRRRTVASDDAGDISIDAPLSGNWHPHIPEPPAEFPKLATFQLTRAEAEFFREQLQVHAGESLVCFLVQRGERANAVAPWMHPALAEMEQGLRQWIADGQCYSELMHGAQLLYNLMLAEKKEQEDLIEFYNQAIRDWIAATQDRRAAYQQWSRPLFWSRVRAKNPNLPIGAEKFSEAWIQHLLTDSAPVLENTVMRRLIAEREKQLKGPRARLESRAHLDLWGGASGTEALNYRWPITRTLVNDIVCGLEG